MSIDPRGSRWPTSSTRPPPRDYDCSPGDWEKIVQIGPRRFDHILYLRGVATRGW